MQFEALNPELQSWFRDLDGDRIRQAEDLIDAIHRVAFAPVFAIMFGLLMGTVGMTVALMSNISDSELMQSLGLGVWVIMIAIFIVLAVVFSLLSWPLYFRRKRAKSVKELSLLLGQFPYDDMYREIIERDRWLAGELAPFFPQFVS